MWTMVLLGAVLLGLTFLWAFQDKIVKRTTNSSQDGFDAALKYGREVAVVGESHRNKDGSSRNDIIACLSRGDMVELVREPRNKYDPNAIFVRSLYGGIGYIGRDNAEELAEWLDRGEHLATYISKIAGGPKNGVENYGVWLRVLSIEQIPEILEERG